MTICSQIHTKHINSVCGQNAGSLISSQVVHPLHMKFNFSLRVPGKIFIVHFQIVYSFGQKTCLLLFSWSKQSFSSCTTANAISTQWRTQNFFGCSTNSGEDRGQRERGSGGSSQLFGNSEGSCNLVQVISFHIVEVS